MGDVERDALPHDLMVPARRDEQRPGKRPAPLPAPVSEPDE